MKYFVEDQHTKEECLRALDEYEHKGSDFLGNCYFTCSAGEHKAYCFVDASNESEVRNMVPSLMRDKTRIMKVDTYTPEQIRSFHQ